jgi:ABC-type transport system involved in cytochrome bd biosynthesis fused ATPase/permease subunit
VITLKGKSAALWIQIREQLRPHWAEIKELGLSGLWKVIREQGPVLWAKTQEQAKAAWQWVTAKVKAVPGSRQALLHVAVALAVVSLWLVFQMVPGAMAAALSLTMVVAYIALVVAFLAYGGVSVIFSAVKPAEAAVK